jgi:hypothetical protein
MRWAGYVVSKGDMRNLYKILDVKPEGERALGRRRRRWEDNIRMDLRDIRWESVDCMRVAQDGDQ